MILLATAVAEGQAADSPESRNRSAAEVGKQVAMPLSDIWLMQFEPNNNWIGMPQKQRDRFQSDLFFQPLIPLRLTGDGKLVTRPILRLFNSEPNVARRDNPGAPRASVT